ncbi:hypothetical protein CVT26_007384, partial [Gymnopilus dilepis]
DFPDLDSELGPVPREDPPPYTFRPSTFAGETTVEAGPARPFQAAPASNNNNARLPPSGGARVQSNASAPGPVPGSYPTPVPVPVPVPSPARTGGGGGGNLLQQITSSINQIVDEINSAFNPPSSQSQSSYSSSNLRPTRTGGSYNWSSSSSYPGQQAQAQGQQGSAYAPPPGPPPPAQSNSTSNVNANASATHPGLIPPPRHPSTRSTPSYPFFVSASASSSARPSTSSHLSSSSLNSNSQHTRTPSPGITSPHQTQTPSANPTSPSSDFAREFYAAGTGEGLNLVSNSDEEDDVPLASTSAARGVRRTASMGDLKSASGPSSRAATSGTGQGGGEAGDDNKPTTHPVPGRVLMREGKVLVYPGGYECDK